MKILMHIISAIVGLLVAGLIVFFVFGNASRQGAVQDGEATNTTEVSAKACGTIPPARTGTNAALLAAKDNMPTLIGETGRPIMIDAKQRPDHQRWVERVTAASGLCLEELKIGPVRGTTELTMIQGDGVTDAQLRSYVGAAAMAAHKPPLNERAVRVIVVGDDKPRELFVTTRTYGAFEVWRKSHRAGSSINDIRRFSRSGVRLGKENLQIIGW